MVIQNVNAKDKDSLGKCYGWKETKGTQLRHDPTLNPGRGEVGERGWQRDMVGSSDQTGIQAVKCSGT